MLVNNSIENLEQEASKIIHREVAVLLKKLPKQYFTRCLPNYYTDVQASPLYQWIKSMPKAVLHHNHLECNEDAEFYRQCVFTDPRVYIDKQGKFKLGTKEQAIENDWEPIKSVLEDKGEDYLLNRTIFNREDILKYSGNENVWQRFQAVIENFFPIVWADHLFKKYTKHVFLKYAKNGYDRVQFRILATNLTQYDEEGNIIKVHPISHYIQQVDAVMDEVQQIYPNFEIGMIYIGLKVFSREQNQALLNQCLGLKWKRAVGLDFANHEDTFGPLDQYDKIIEDVYAKNPDCYLPKVYHAGETKDHKNRNIEIAVKAGSKRIGHGINILQNLDLVQSCKDTCFELNPLSNLILNYISDPRHGHAPLMFHLGLPITISPDDPGKFGYQDSTFDFMVALTCYNWAIPQLKQTFRWSIQYALCSSEQKGRISKKFQEEWLRWLQQLVKSEIGLKKDQ